MSDIEITNEPTVTQSDPNPIEEIAGVPDGFVDHADEVIVYEYDPDGNVTGWHKEPAA
jgi:hypothetical protein